jgi:CheY-like chemotaxis protein
MEPLGTESFATQSTQDKIVLCVDDEKTGLMVRRILLEHQGYKVLTAEGGTEAVALFEQYPVNAVVLDYAMPGLNGAEVATLMRQRKPEVPILLLSAYVTFSEEVLKLVDQSMTKGDGPTVLLEHLHRLISNPSHSGWGRPA